jgi:predicted Rdx family selenoprotein
LAAKITRQHPDAEVETVPGGKGDFIVTVDGQQIWNKRRMNDDFPDERVLLEGLALGR